MADVERILIVGGGIGGLTLAAALRRRGFAPELVERGAAWEAIGAGLAVQPNGVRVLRALGMGDALERAGAAIHRWEFCDRRGDLLFSTDLDALWAEVAPFLGVERARLQTVLLEGAAAVPTRLGVGVAGLAPDERGVRVTFDDGTAGDYDLVVGADGIHSTVRRLAIGADAPVYGGQLAWRSVAPVRPRGLTRLQFHLGDDCFFGLCPVGDGRTYGFGNVARPRTHDPLDGRLARLRAQFSAFGDAVREYLDALDSDEQIHASAVEWMERDAWFAGRVVLLGDAAHASSPMMGQGGSLAMEDAYVLAEELRARPDVESALRAYAERRGPRVAWVRQQSRAVGESLRVPAETRDAVLRSRGDQGMQMRFQPLVAEP